jgi:hypothetical protein
MRRRIDRRAAALVGLGLAIGIFASPVVRAAESAEKWTPPSFPPVDLKKDPQESFDLAALGVVRLDDKDWRAFRGKYRDFVEQEDFLLAVGRQDLADRMRSSRHVANVLSYGGRAVALTGLVLLIADASPGGFRPAPALGLGLCAGGLLSWLVSGFIGGAVATPDEAESFADHYNTGLRAHIDHLHQTPPETGTVARAPKLQPLLPWIAANSGRGLSVALTF